LCHTPTQVVKAINTIFDKQTAMYDYIALAQEYVPTDREYRFICFRGSPVLTYERYLDGQRFKVKYWESPEGKILNVGNPIIEELLEFVQPVYNHLDLGFCGFDILRNVQGELYLLELNSAPGFQNYIDLQGPAEIVQMYKKIFKTFLLL